MVGAAKAFFPIYLEYLSLFCGVQRSSRKKEEGLPERNKEHSQKHINQERTE